jgi:hypothetical protein
LLADYPNFGVHTLKLCPFKLNSQKLVTWQNISYLVVEKSGDGHDTKVFRVEYCETQSSQLIGYLKPIL